MKHRLYLHLVASGLATFAFAACASPGSAYAARHPELSPAHRQILLRGKIPGGDAVAGLTREQVQLAMGGDPTTFDKVGKEDAWIYTRRKAAGRESFGDLGPSGTTRIENTHGSTQANDAAPGVEVETKTTVFFQGDRATHAQSTDENP